ncbi:MAG: hypothetical protein H7123_09435 [Thermoleophilia bacterium]|nr:hypothetical protein [Thermoleophilia bacterium]
MPLFAAGKVQLTISGPSSYQVRGTLDDIAPVTFILTKTAQGAVNKTCQPVSPTFCPTGIW